MGSGIEVQHHFYQMLPYYSYNVNALYIDIVKRNVWLYMALYAQWKWGLNIDME
ncbi:hypothetical protein ACJX0J_030608, partial [Zea mays]